MHSYGLQNTIIDCLVVTQNTAPTISAQNVCPPVTSALSVDLSCVARIWTFRCTVGYDAAFIVYCCEVEIQCGTLIPHTTACLADSDSPNPTSIQVQERGIRARINFHLTTTPTQSLRYIYVFVVYIHVPTKTSHTGRRQLTESEC